jgi:hypothetical protein
MHKKQTELNLRGIRFNDLSDLQNEVELILDKFLRPYLKSNNHNKRLTIVVGRGLNSSTFIDNKNPLRFYTENYLNMLGMEWKNNSLNQGVIEVFC